MTAESTVSKRSRIMASWMVREKSRFTAGDVASHLSTTEVICQEDTARTLLFALYEDGKLARHVADDGSVKYSGNAMSAAVLRRAWVPRWVQGLKCSPEWC